MWDLADVPKGTITNGELMSLYKLLSCSVSDEHRQLAVKIQPMYEIAINDKVHKNTWADEGGACPEPE